MMKRYSQAKWTDEVIKCLCMLCANAASRLNGRTLSLGVGGVSLKVSWASLPFFLFSASAGGIEIHVWKFEHPAVAKV